jgi:hypothetical protein
MGYMKRTQADTDRLIAELQLDYAQLDELAAENDRAFDRIRMGSSDRLDHSALGYTIHNIYGTMENTCLRISKFFENNLSEDSWHKDLLRRMLLIVPRVRPALLTQEAFIAIDELRGFRHVFRNSYNRPLDPERLLLLQKRVPTAIRLFKEAVSDYMRFLEDLRGKIED